MNPTTKRVKPGMVNISDLTMGHVGLTLVKNPVNSHERGKKDGKITTTMGRHPWSSVRKILNVPSNMGIIHSSP